MRVLATFATRDIADSMKAMLVQHGFYESDMVVITNRTAVEPPDDAEIEVGTDGPKGFAGLEEKIGKAVNELLGKHEILEGTGSEGEPNGGSLLLLTAAREEDANRAVDLLRLHQAADIEVTHTE